MDQIWNELFTKENIQLICVPGFIIAFSIFAKYMEIRQDRKDAEAQKNQKTKNLLNVRGAMTWKSCRLFSCD